MQKNLVTSELCRYSLCRLHVDACRCRFGHAVWTVCIDVNGQ